MAVHPATASAPQVTGAIRQAAQSTGISFEYLLTTAKNRIQFQPHGAGLHVVGERALSVHRPDLARHHEAGRAGESRDRMAAFHLLRVGAVTRAAAPLWQAVHVEAAIHL